MATTFDSDDESYQRWLAANPDGYVINTGRGKPPSYMVLHRARCRKISDYNKVAREGGFTERDLIKVCSMNLADLRNWVRQHGRTDGSFSGKCGLCKPCIGAG
jgi:hypothetical protein